MKQELKRFAVNPLALATAATIPLAFAATSGWSQGKNPLVLEEVIVTAQKKAENVQDIPATINAVSAQTIEDYTLLDFSDLSSVVPGVSLQREDARRATITIRGVTADPDNIAKQPITTYVNEVPVRQGIIFSAMYDIERVEVLRGPQGTLQGRTDPAGSILTYTARPNMSEWDGYVQQTFTDQPGSNTQFGASLPLIEDTLGFRIAGVYDDNEGQQYENIITGQEEQNRTKSARATMDWAATNDMDFVLTYTYIDQTNTLPEALFGSQGEYATIPGTPGGPMLPPPNTPILTDPNYPQYLSKDDRKAFHGGLNHNELEVNMVSLLMNWDLGPGTLTAVGGYYDYQQVTTLDRNISYSLPVPESQLTDTDLQYYMAELRFASNEGAFGGFWDYIVGVNWEKTDSHTLNTVNATGNVLLNQAVLPPSIDQSGQLLAVTDVPISRPTLSFFTHNTFNFTDSLNLQFGLRYQEATIDSRADLSYNDTMGTGQQGQCLIPDGTACSTNPNDLTKTEDEQWTGSLKLAWFVMDDTMLYGSLDTSYRPPGVVITPTPLDSSNLLFDRETSTSFEVGFKSTMADGRVRLNGALFYQQFDGFQARAVEPTVYFYDDMGNPSPTKMSGGLTYNADATVQGVELEMQSLITERWSLGASGAYVESFFDDGETGPCNEALSPAEIAAQVQVAGCDIGGERISQQPLFSGNINTEWYLPIASTEWYIRGLYNYRSASTTYLVPGQSIDAYGILSLWTGFRSADAKWDINVWAKNIADEQQLSGLFTAEALDYFGTTYTSDWRRANMIQPRTVGLTARFNW